MRYLKVQWLHDSPDYPVTIYSELNEEGWESRKVEHFSNGKIGYASAEEDTPETGTKLALVPVPSTQEIADNPEFVPQEISQTAFEQIWSQRHGN